MYTFYCQSYKLRHKTSHCFEINGLFRSKTRVLFFYYSGWRRKIESIIDFRCRQRNPNPRVNGQYRKRCLPRFRHYPLTRGLEFLGLHQRPMINYFFYLWHENYLSFVILFILRRITTFSERRLAIFCGGLVTVVTDRHSDTTVSS